MKRAAIALVLLCCGCGVSQQQGLQMHKEIREQGWAIDDLRREHEDDVSQLAERLDALERRQAATQPSHTDGGREMAAFTFDLFGVPHPERP